MTSTVSEITTATTAITIVTSTLIYSTPSLP